MNSGTVVEILREEVCVERGTHEDYLQVWPRHSQVFQHQQQEVTAKKNINLNNTEGLLLQDKNTLRVENTLFFFCYLNSIPQHVFLQHGVSEILLQYKYI